MDLFLLVPPSVYFGVVVGSVVGFAFHALVGHQRRSSLFYLPFGLTGFLAGGMAAQRIGLDYMLVGDVSVLTGILGALIGLPLAHLLVA